MGDSPKGRHWMKKKSSFRKELEAEIEAGNMLLKGQLKDLAQAKAYVDLKVNPDDEESDDK